MDISSFNKLGLQKAEVAIYLALLKFGSVTVAKIAKETRLTRTHIYDTLNKLLDKGLISSVIKYNVRYFNAGHPEKLVDYVNELKEYIQEILPELKQLCQIPKSKTKVELYESKEGIKTVLKDIIRQKKNYLVLGEQGQFQTLLPSYMQQYLRDIIKFKIKESILARANFRNKIPKTKNTLIKYLGDEFFSPTITLVYGNKIAIFVWTEPYYALVIENEEVAESYKHYFKVLWEIAKK